MDLSSRPIEFCNHGSRQPFGHHSHSPKFGSENGHFTLNSKTSFAIGKTQRADLKKVAAYFQSKILYSTGYNLNIKNSGSSNTISLQIDKSLKIGNEGYQLTVTPKR